MGGRIKSEWVAGYFQNQWPDDPGIRSRLGVSAVPASILTFKWRGNVFDLVTPPPDRRDQIKIAQVVGPRQGFRPVMDINFNSILLQERFIPISKVYRRVTFPATDKKG